MSNDHTQRVIAEATADGWQIVSRDQGGIQVRKPKQWSKPAVILGLVLLIFAGLGILVLLLAALDYAMAKDKLAYLTTAQLEAGTGPGKDKPAATAGGLAKTFVYVVGGLIAVTVIIGLAMRWAGI